MITYFLIFIVVSLAMGFAVQGYEGLTLKLELSGYSVELSVAFAIFALCIAVLLLVLMVRACLALALIMHRLRCKSIYRRYDALGYDFARLGIGDIQDVRQIVKESGRVSSLNSPVLNLLRGCACFRLGQYEVAENYFSLVPRKNVPGDGMGAWMLEVLSQEKSRDCKLRVLSRLCEIFCEQPWSALLRLEIARVREEWQDVLTEIRFISKNGIRQVYDRDLEAIACVKLAEMCYARGDYNGGLVYIKKTSGLQAELIRARLHAKLGNTKKALAGLEACYAENPHREVAELYMEMVSIKYDGIKRLSSLNENSYVSYVLDVRRCIDAKQYNAAEKQLKQALTKYKYVELYGMMLEIMVRLENLDDIEYWVGEMRKEAVQDMRWVCTGCSGVAEKWHHECCACGRFNSIQWM